jgi:hypothetical protein
MSKTPATTAAYAQALPIDRRAVFESLCEVFRKNLPDGFSEGFAYGMVSFCVPHTTYPDGYHCDPSIPLPFVQIASQKKHLAVYHMGLYVIEGEVEWLTSAWAAATTQKLDLGKSCLRLDPAKPLPLELLATLASRTTVERWISAYDKIRPARKPSKPKKA